MANDKLVSVMTTTRNRARMLIRAIDSVFSQTHENLELILVDDHSTDRTSELVSSITDPRLRYIRLEECVGAAKARNIALNETRGEFLCFLDDDDVLFPEKLQRQLDEFSAAPADVGLIYCGFTILFESEDRAVMDVHPTIRGDVYAQVLGRNYFAINAPLVRKECFERIGRFDTMLSSCIDWDMWIRIAHSYEFGFVPESLCACYIHGDQISSSLEKKIAGREYIMQKYEEDLLKYPASFSDSLRRLGILHCLARNPKGGRSYFRRAISTRSAKKSVYMHLYLAALVPELHARMLEKRFTRKVGENRFLL